MNKYCIIVFGILAFFSCNKDKDTQPDNEERLMETIEYKSVNDVEPNLLSLDIYYTSKISEKKPIVVWVHGGGWCIGDKSNNMEDKVNLFQSENWLFVSVNYQLSPIPYEVSNPDRIKYPDHNNDISDAIYWIYNNIENFGGDPSRIALFGHSAGAHLVSLLGTRKSFIENKGMPFSVVKGVAAIDTEGYNVKTMVDGGSDLYINAFGTNSNENVEASPVYNINQESTYPKFFIAKRGTSERIEKANAFIQALTEAGVFVDQVDGSIYSHSEINEAIGKSGETLITEPLLEFFRGCFE